MDANIAPVLGRIPSGIFILTVGDGTGRETGMLCSWVQQASLASPSVTMAVRNDRYVNEWLQTTKQAVLNLVGESAKQLLGHFGRGFKQDEPAFNGIEIKRGTTGLPCLVDALGYLEGRITGQFFSDDHIIYLLEITAAGQGEMFHEEQPMVHIRKNGLNY